MRLLDTNLCSRIMDADPQVLAHLAKHATDGFCTSIIVQGELEYMVYRSDRFAENRIRPDNFLGDLNVFEIDGRTALTYGQLKADLFDHFGPKDRAARRRFSLAMLGFAENDLWIAATALQHGLTVISSDADFPRIQQIRSLSLESW